MTFDHYKFTNPPQYKRLPIENWGKKGILLNRKWKKPWVTRGLIFPYFVN